VGKKAWKFGEILESAGNSEFAGDIVFTGYVDGADLPALFSGARLFVYPSLFEGFGYPPLEAMGCGTPVVTSNVASLPEVCGDAAEYVDPLDTADIARATLKVYSDEDLRVRMREGGLAQAARHRNNDLGAITVRAYEEAAAESSGAGK
jgi:glycosyltransferase involved in cell wall biosynthesis